MRVINTKDLIPVVKDLVIKACTDLDDNLMEALTQSIKVEESELGKEVLETLIENANLAREKEAPCCQDTGIAVVYLEIGQEVCWEGPGLTDSINEGVRQGYKEGYLRNSVVGDPIIRENTKDNTPAVIHTKIVEGRQVKITVMPKGAGSENMGRASVLKPADGVEGIMNYVMETVGNAGGKACPPLIVGVGLGGSMEKSTLLAKEALQRPIGDRSPVSHIAALEAELLTKINDLGIGPIGIGGRVTALDVHIETFPCHIASLPISVNLQCHANRHASKTI
ncbi:fumarate hydratase [Isachenkonia alkalipeptolytica]|uniref:Fumarate hydratase n=1 Tax=Isachenkonia alkalipeptolytica TaxID=2565777 RepID=A0AA43XLG8_9CLOT|nr:fumarate hydratase [Isachenkonia alkalipeptolytica]NBG88852.1 fumarate hydratase [Isachenkonia alkalipeptolytica]